jgi:DNA-directed RNA polymerase specialized sigma24 family protein
MDLPQPSFDAFVRQHAGELLRTAAVITWDDDEAQDLAQECLSASRAIGRVCGEWIRRLPTRGAHW